MPRSFTGCRKDAPIEGRLNARLFRQLGVPYLQE